LPVIEAPAQARRTGQQAHGFLLLARLPRHVFRQRRDGVANGLQLVQQKVGRVVLVGFRMQMLRRAVIPAVWSKLFEAETEAKSHAGGGGR
jgi:hypothetical protein